MGNVIRQAGAIPFKYEAGDLRVLLITSRGAGRWVIPKGWIEDGASAAQAAAQEAFEEAGITGLIDETPLGSFEYSKRLGSGAKKLAMVEVFALRVEKQRKKWPERAERRFKWMDVPSALNLLEYPGMAALFQTLVEIHGNVRNYTYLNGALGGADLAGI